MSLAQQQVRYFNLRMAVLTVFEGGFVTRFDGLLRTGMQTRQAGCTMRTDSGNLRGMARYCRFALCKRNITHRADSGADSATDTFLRVDRGAERADHPFLHPLRAHDPR